MNKSQRSRLLGTLVISLGVVLGFWLIIQGLSDGLHLYITPSQVHDLPSNRSVHMGGVVVEDSFARLDNKLQMRFQVSDGHEGVWVNYEGVLPAMFKEGRSVVAVGRIEQGEMLAETILAKHDEYYQPREGCDVG